MAPSKIRNVIGAVKDQTSIALATVGSSSSLSDLEVAIVKATRHEENPPNEKHIREILCLTCYSLPYIGACVRTISRRISKTKNWVVALKALMLIQRLLTEGDPVFAQEIFFATRQGTRLLNMSGFRDSSPSNSWDYSAFIRSYASYLDEHLEFKMQGKCGKHSAFAYDEDDENEVGRKDKGAGATPVHEMNNEWIFSRIHHLMQLLQRFLACRPAGIAKYNRVVTVALYPIVQESFQLYHGIAGIICILVERFMELDIPDSVKVYEIFCRVSKEYDELDAFYDLCKSVGVARSLEYPKISKIPSKKLDVMDEFIKEKSIIAQMRNRIMVPKPEPTVETKESKPDEDMNGNKSLPPPEELLEETDKDKKKDKKVTSKKIQEVGDLLNLGVDAPTTEEHGEKLSLALFDSYPAPTITCTPTPWEAFKESDDWEAALVQSASHLSNQKASLPRGLDSLTLDGMYQQGAIAQAVASSGLVATGSASSVAIGSTGRPAMLTLPAPPPTGGAAANTSTHSDPFAASLAIAPPPYVQMFETEKKQRLLVEEQLMWQQYARDGLQGPVGLASPHQNPYPYSTGGGYMRTY